MLSSVQGCHLFFLTYFRTFILILRQLGQQLVLYSSIIIFQEAENKIKKIENEAKEKELRILDLENQLAKATSDQEANQEKIKTLEKQLVDEREEVFRIIFCGFIFRSSSIILFCFSLGNLAKLLIMIKEDRTSK